MVKVVVAYTTTTDGHALEALRLEGPIRRAGLEFLVGNERGDPHDVLSTADIVVIQRDFPRQLDTYRQVMACAHAYHKPVVYEIDDLLWDLPEGHPYRQNHYFGDALVPMLLAAVQADGVTVSTPNLGEYIRSINPNTWILPNYLDDHVWTLRPPKPARKSPVVLGYIGPKGVHEQDLRTVQPALQRILERFRNHVQIKFWGPIPPDELASYSNVEHIPLAMANYRTFASYCASQDCDIFIAPLEFNRFNQCKSPIKFLEYSALGVVGVYSRVAPYQMVVQQGENGFLAETADEWYEHLVRLVENPTLRYEMSCRAFETVRANWLLSDHAEEWIRVYDKIVSSGDSPASPERKYLGEHVVAAIAVQLAEWQQDKDKVLEALKAQMTAPASDQAGLSKLLRRVRLWLVPSTSRRARALRLMMHACHIGRTEGVVALVSRFTQFLLGCTVLH